MSEFFRKPIVKTLMLKGEKGEGVKEIKKTGTNGLEDTYTITLTDGTTSTFSVANGKGISSISKTGTSELVDTYTITFNDGTTSTFTVTNGAKGDKGDKGDRGDTGWPTDAQTESAVTKWLNEHPEATTTVQDNSLTIDKMVVGTLGYVTPEMFGAVGDGVTDDKVALQKCADNGGLVYLGDKTYHSSGTINITKNVRFSFGRIHFKSNSSIQNGFYINTKDISLEMDFVDIFSDRDNKSGTFADTVLSSNIIGINISSPYGENAKIRLSHCNFYDLEYGVKDECKETHLRIVDCTIKNTLMCIYSASSKIYANNCYLECIATNKLYHCAYIATVNILSHEWRGCTFRMTSTSFNDSQGLHYYNDSRNMVGDAQVMDCDMDGIVDHVGVLTIIGGKINKTYYGVKKIVNCYITGNISASKEERETMMCGCIIDGGRIELNNASLVMDACVIKLSGDVYPIMFATGGNAGLKIHNCSIEYNIDSHIFRINGTHDVEVVNSIIKRPGSSLIIYATPELTDEAKSKFVGNIVMSEGEFPTANNIILRN